MRILIVLALLSGCASLQEQAEECQAAGGIPVIQEHEYWQYSCDCDAKSTFLKDCPRGGFVTMSKGSGACGLMVTTSIACLDDAEADALEREINLKHSSLACQLQELEECAD